MKPEAMHEFYCKHYNRNSGLYDRWSSASKTLMTRLTALMLEKGLLTEEELLELMEWPANYQGDRQ